MAVTLCDDILSVINAIAADPYIQSLGFTRSKMYNTMTVDELLQDGQKQIFVYFAASTAGLSGLSIKPTLEIDVSAPISEASKAQKAAEHIISMFQSKRINGHTQLDLVAPSPCSLACQYGFECIGIRFIYSSTVYKNN